MYDIYACVRVYVYLWRATYTHEIIYIDSVSFKPKEQVESVDILSVFSNILIRSRYFTRSLVINKSYYYRRARTLIHVCRQKLLYYVNDGLTRGVPFEFRIPVGRVIASNLVRRLTRTTRSTRNPNALRIKQSDVSSE